MEAIEELGPDNVVQVRCKAAGPCLKQQMQCAGAAGETSSAQTKLVPLSLAVAAAAVSAATCASAVALDRLPLLLLLLGVPKVAAAFWTPVR
jgi:hypothetical protein